MSHLNPDGTVNQVADDLWFPNGSVITPEGVLLVDEKRADEQIKRFVRQQKKLDLWSRTVMFIVSDHSMATNERKTSLTEIFTAAGIPTSSYLIVQNGGTDFVYLADPAAADRDDLLRRMRQAALAADLTGAERGSGHDRLAAARPVHAVSGHRHARVWP